MSASESPLDSLIALLNELGVPTLAGPTELPEGFPLCVPLANGEELVLDLPTPGAIAGLDPDHIGVAIVGPTGRVNRVWGLASRVPAFQRVENCMASEIGPLLIAAFDGVAGSMYLDGVRYHASGLHIGLSTCAFVLVTNAAEEREARRNESKSARAASALTRIGKSLTMDQRVRPLCVAATHEIASAAELAAVLVWVVDSEDGALTLVAHTGANRHATHALERLSASGGSSCLAELVAESQQPFHLCSALDHMMSAELEARICYLKAGGISIQPLLIGNRLLGVLELIGRDGDASFTDNRALFQTIAEHMSLALNSAILFESFERMATHDALTGIANHRMLQEFLQRRVSEAKRTGQEAGVIMIDVDHFRSFNEEEGHDAGDRVLKMVAEAIKGCLRQYDLPARYGGEEFAVVLPGAGLDATAAMAERIRRAIEAIEYATASGRPRTISVSVGCSSFPATAGDPTALLKAADVALYSAKRAGRNRVVAFEGSCSDEERSMEFDPERILRCVPPARQDAAREYLASAESLLGGISERLGLSERQTEILRGLLLLLVPHREAKSEGDRVALRQMESGEEFRLLQPALDAFDERFDGTGPKGVAGSKIPFLARVLAVLAEGVGGGGGFASDPGRFDPEIVRAVAEIDDAA